MDVEIQRAVSPDAPSILQLQYLCYQSEARLYGDWSIPPLTQTLAELNQEFATATLLKALLGGRIVGSVRATCSEGTCSVGRLIVHPELQRRGIGRRLMHEIEREFSAAARFELFTGSRSERNIRLYESLGYRQCRMQTISPTLTLVFMEKPSRGNLAEADSDR